MRTETKLPNIGLWLIKKIALLFKESGWIPRFAVPIATAVWGFRSRILDYIANANAELATAASSAVNVIEINPILGYMLPAGVWFILALFSHIRKLDWEILQFEDTTSCAIEIIYEQTSDFEQETFHGQALPQNRVKYFRVLPKAKLAHLEDCQVFLTEIERQVDGSYLPTEYSESHQLAWSSALHGSFSRIDLRRGVRQFADVLMVNASTQSVVPCVHSLPNTANAVFVPLGWYRLTILASSKGRTAAELKLLFHWTGQIDSCTMHQEEALKTIG